jgi:hypothetical protein
MEDVVFCLTKMVAPLVAFGQQRLVFGYSNHNKVFLSEQSDERTNEGLLIYIDLFRSPISNLGNASLFVHEPNHAF